MRCVIGTLCMMVGSLVLESGVIRRCLREAFIIMCLNSPVNGFCLLMKTMLLLKEIVMGRWGEFLHWCHTLPQSCEGLQLHVCLPLVAYDRASVKVIVPAVDVALGLASHQGCSQGG